MTVESRELQEEGALEGRIDASDLVVMPHGSAVKLQKGCICNFHYCDGLSIVDRVGKRTNHLRLAALMK